MATIEWGKTGERLYETGLSHGVLYPRQTSGVPWNGLISVTETVSGGESDSFYFDGLKYLDFIAAEDFSATIEAYSTPPEFDECDGSKVLSPGLYATQQPRYPFGFSYRTKIGNDVAGSDLGYKLHLVYNAMASPASRVYQSDSNTPSPVVRQWSINTAPPSSSTYKPTAHFVIDSTKANAQKLTLLENALYGSFAADATLPSQADVIDILS